MSEYKKMVIKFNTNPHTYKLKYPVRLKHISLQKVILYNSYYLINSNNDKFHYNDTSYTIKHGNYSGEELASELSNISNMTVSYDNINAKFTFTYNSSITWAISNNDKSLNFILGFDNADKGPSTSITSDNVANLSLTPFYKIDIDELYDNDIENLNSYEIIYNIEPAGYMLYYNKDYNYFKHEYNKYNKTITKLSISIKDQHNNKIDFNNQPIIFEFIVKEC